ncbi:hypothetical protein BGW38_001951 [Lunasporangiospora selenospora]|uniref:Complex 1 LYR protein domain-containing protein n=1 Tax=Lunasporangiospora selenospora TaxID=979761 RepID=A0A9P6FT89_9FUNG|nr:hypothetical protein BGW38_001951 [Lunasporangiospora selenospora]
MSGQSAALQQRARVLSLYRQLLRIGKAMPTDTRSSLVLSRVKREFRDNKAEKDPETIEGMIQLAEVQIDNLSIQRDHLTELSKNPNLIIPVDIYKNAKPKVSRFMKGPPLSWERKAMQLEKDKVRQQAQSQQQPQQKEHKSHQCCSGHKTPGKN